MKKLIIIWCVISISVNLFSQSKEITVKVLNNIAGQVLVESQRQIINRQTNEIFRDTTGLVFSTDLDVQSPYCDWRYWNGVLYMAMSELGNVLDNDEYREYSSKNFEYIFDSYNFFKNNYQEENKWTYPFAQLFRLEWLDDCGAMGAALIDVYMKENKKRYLDYIMKASNHILTVQERLEDGTLVRPDPVVMTLWADDLYMSVPFLARMGKLTGERKYFDEAANQVIQFTNYLFDTNSNLLFHCWYSDEQVNGVAHWGRANGWVMMAQVELLTLLPDDHPTKDTLVSLLRRQFIGISRYQDVSGLWNQLLDKQDSYLESSCTAMFTYGIAKAVNQGWIPERYFVVAKQGWNGLIKKTTDEGKIEGICVGTGIQDKISYYYNRPVNLNDIHGIGAVILAGNEILKHQIAWENYMKSSVKTK